MKKEDITIFLTTLIINDFRLLSVNRIAEGNVIISAEKVDVLGAKIPYAILLNTDNPNAGLIDNLLVTAAANQATPLVVSDNITSDQCKVIKISEFSKLLGGLVNTGLILLPNLAEILESLGHNILPTGLDGEPDNLLEIYAKECLQYIMAAPAKRFGSNRIFERLPDGIVLGAMGSFSFLFDGKAYKDGFSFSSDDVLRFAEYVNDFNMRYSPYVNISYFLVVSGHFQDSKVSIENRSNDLFNKCKARLCCVESSVLGKLVILLGKQQLRKNAILWQNVFAQTIITENEVQKELRRIKKDEII